MIFYGHILIHIEITIDLDDFLMACGSTPASCTIELAQGRHPVSNATQLDHFEAFSMALMAPAALTKDASAHGFWHVYIYIHIHIHC